jgi:rare lipoprotein A
MKFNATAGKSLFLFQLVTLLLFTQLVFAQDTTSTQPILPNTKTFYGQASFYADKFNGRKTASGEVFSQTKMTCACNAVKMGTWLRITNLRNGYTVIVKVNDRIHPGMKRVTDLSRAAANQLGFAAAGLTRVKVEVLGKIKPEH